MTPGPESGLRGLTPFNVSCRVHVKRPPLPPNLRKKQQNGRKTAPCRLPVNGSGVAGRENAKVMSGVTGHDLGQGPDRDLVAVGRAPPLPSLRRDVPQHEQVRATDRFELPCQLRQRMIATGNRIRRFFSVACCLFPMFLLLEPPHATAREVLLRIAKAPGTRS